MAQVVTGNLSITTSASESVTNGLGTGRIAPALSPTLAFANGTGANSIDLVHTVSGSAAGSAVTLVLSNLTDGLGRTLSFDVVRVLVIVNGSTTNGHDLSVGAAAANPWAAPFANANDIIKIGAGGVLVLASPLATGYAVTASSSDQLKIDPGANTIPYSVMIMGED